MAARVGGAAGWLIARLRGSGRKRPRLKLLERIALGPRQSLSLIEAEGRVFLVATSADGGAAFYPLNGGEAEEREVDECEVDERVPSVEPAHVPRAARASW